MGTVGASGSRPSVRNNTEMHVISHVVIGRKTGLQFGFLWILLQIHFSHVYRSW